MLWRKSAVVLVGIVYLFNNGAAQNLTETSFGTCEFDYPREVELFGNELFISGFTDGIDWLKPYTVITRIDSTGNPAWTKAFPTGVVSTHNAHANLRITHDSMLLLLGTHNFSASGDGFSYLAKLNLQGDIQWLRPIGQEGQDICEISNGDIIISSGGGSGDILHFDSTGTLRFIKRHHGGHGVVCYGIHDGSTRFNSIVPSNNGYVSSGTTMDSLRKYLHVHQVDTSGTTVWRSTYEYECASAIITRISNGNFVVAGVTDISPRKLFSASIDTQGTLQWSYEYIVDSLIWNYTPVTLNYNFDLVANDDGGFYLSALVGSSPPSSRLIVKLDSSGSVLFSNIYHSREIDDGEQGKVAASANGLILATPTIVDSTISQISGQTDIQLFTIGALGASSVPYTNATVSRIPVSFDSIINTVSDTTLHSFHPTTTLSSTNLVWGYDSVTCLTASVWESVDIAPVLRVFPNPSNGIATVHLTSAVHDGRYSVYSTTGALVEHRYGLYGDTFRLDLQGTRPGIYWIRLVDQSGTESTARFSVE